MPIIANDAIATQQARPAGLYAARDFIRAGEEEEYANTLIDLMKELSPEGILEETFATEVMGATWRLRRCRMVEEDFTGLGDFDFDPMVDERTEKAQRSVDRARAQSHNILRRCLAELRRLQTERQIHIQTDTAADCPVLTDIGKVARAMKAANTLEHKPRDSQNVDLDNFEAMLGLSDAQLNRLAMTPPSSASHEKPVSQVPDPPPSVSPASFCKDSEASFCKSVEPLQNAAGSFCKPVPSAPGNAPCPCGSGAKYKRCCGKSGSPALSRAA